MFENINFKYTDAEEEKLYAPELIEDAYVDINDIIEQVQRPEKYLVIGPKGAGKTALSSKLQLMAKPKWNFFVDTDELEQFEFNLLNKSGGEKGTSIGGAVTVWQMILAIRLLPLLLEDENLKNVNPQLVTFNSGLQKYGLTASDNLITIVQYTSRRGIFGKIKSVISEVQGEKTEEEKFNLKDPAAILESMKQVLNKIKPTESQYFLVLDGLDHPMRKGRNNAPYIADLINAVRLLNMFFSGINLRAKIIILIRDEILQIVPDPNLTKRINDNGIELKWYDNSRDPLETSLMRIIENRAKLSGYNLTVKELWKLWFPEKINKKESHIFVLDNTRHLPRDIISFFRELQKLGKKPPFRREDVLAALNNYSDWYLNELSDALVGLIDESVRTELPDILSTLGRNFSCEKFKLAAKDHGIAESANTEQVLKDLYNTSWIGNSWETHEHSQRYSWRHRKRNSKLDLKKNMVIHCGLWKTLNLI